MEIIYALLIATNLLLPDESADPPPADPKEAGTEDRSAHALPQFPSWIHLGGQLRGRLEDPSSIGYAAGTSDLYYLDRLRLNLRVQPLPWMRFFAETQDTRSISYNVPLQPATIYNPLDLRQAYVDLGGESASRFWLKVGRQEMSLGSTRLVGISDWGVSRTFDAVRGAYSAKGVKIEVFAASVVFIDPSRFDRHKPGERMFGTYWTLGKILPGATLEPYVLVKRENRITSEQGVPGDGAVQTYGFRIAGKAPERIDYSVELAKQAGGFSVDRISAVAGSYVAGWAINGSARKPRVSVESNHASGDDNPRDGTRRTFDQFYANNHFYYGIADQMGWRNMRSGRVGFDFMATKKLKVEADLNDFYLATVQDGLYNASGTRTVLNPKATSRHVGPEVDLFGTWTWSKNLNFGAGVARLFPGQYLKQSIRVNGYLYPYLTWTAAF